MAEVEVLLLGPLEARRDGEPLRLGGLKPRMMLADLALHAGEVLSVDRLIDDLWGERPPRSAPHAVEVNVSKLRRALGPALVTRAPGYALELPGDRIDVGRFAAGAAEGTALVERDPAAAGGMLREALALWRGPALADFAFEPFAQADIARLEELRQQCLEARVDADLGAGRDAELIPELEALIRAAPFRERLRAQLMVALYRGGRASDALALYRSTRQMLLDELAIEPGPELRSLEAAILRQDDSLLAAARPAPGRAPARRSLATVVVLELALAAPELDLEAVHALVVGWHERTAAVVARFGGRVQSAGDESALAVFGVPVAREDDALRAARAALELSDQRVRIGLETGEVVADGTLVTGSAAAGARAAAQRAAVGTVAVGEQAAMFLAHAARLEPATAQLLAVEDDAPPFERGPEAALVGRRDELAKLHAALDSAVRNGACRPVRLVGAPGIGKTRLAHELVETVRDRALGLRTACVEGGIGEPHEPLAAILRGAAGSAAPDERVAAVLAAAVAGGDDTPSPAEVAWAFRRFCERLAADRPLVLVFDDLQWATPTMLALVEQLATRGAGPMLVLCLAREELLGERPSFLPDAECIELDALQPDEAALLLGGLLGGRPLPDDLRARVLDGAEGNPFFVEQLLAFVAEEGTLVDRPLPPTIQALLAARLDRLGPAEHAILSRGAVIGREFATADLSALLDARATTTLAAHLRTLVRRGFVNAMPSGYRFRHGLVHESVYRTTAKIERADLHERYADHVAGAGRADELVGLHLERAHALRAELGAEDRHVRQLAADAGTKLGAAGILAWKRNDASATVDLLRRATRLLDPDSPLARELTCELGLALRVADDATGALEALERASSPASSAVGAPVELRARMELSFVRMLEGGASHGHDLVELAEAGIPTFEALDDDRALGRAWLLLGYVHGARQLRCKAWEEAAELAAVHYERAGFRSVNCLGQLANALYHGPTPAAAAAGRCREMLGTGTLGLAGEATVRAFLGGCIAMTGELDEGRATLVRARAVFDELGLSGLAGVTYGEVAGGIELFAGDFSAAEAILRESCELLRRVGLESTLATRAAQLAAALYEQARFVDAEEWLRDAERVTAPDDLDARLVSQPLRAKLSARSGDHERAGNLALEALALAEQTDALNQCARVLLDVAEVERLAGRRSESAALVERARLDYERKGNRIALQRLGQPTAV